MSDLSNFQPRVRGIDRLFDKLKLSYGSMKMAQMLDGLEVEAVKQNWVEELRRSGFQEARIHKAIDNMLRVHPSWPPTIGDFLALCDAAAAEMPREPLPALPAPTVTAAQVEKAKTDIAKLAFQRSVDRNWPNRIIARHEAGEAITQTVLRMARDGKAALWV